MELPGVIASSTNPIASTVHSEATKPPTLTTPVALPERSTGFSVRA